MAHAIRSPTVAARRLPQKPATASGAVEALDGPLEVTSSLQWAGCGNAALPARIEPVLTPVLRQRHAEATVEGPPPTR